MTTKEIIDNAMTLVIAWAPEIVYAFADGDMLLITHPMDVKYHIPTLLELYNMMIKRGLSEVDATEVIATKLINDLRLQQGESE